MKTIYFILLIFTFPLIINAQIGPVNFIDTSLETSGVTKFESVDLDNDGFNEILVSSTGNAGRIGFYQNLTNNTFSNFNLIESFGFCKGIAVGDFNNDNWKDIVSIGGINKEAKIHINNSGSFSPGVPLDSNISIQVNDVVVADFDNNNSDDIVIIGQHSIDLYRNNGSGSFSKETILTTSSSSTRVLECLDLAAADMDGDGDIDLINGETEGLVIYINNGNAVFSPHYYSLIPEIFFLVHPFDIDNDGDIDVVGRNHAGEVKWFSNNGSSVMTYEAILPNIPNLLSLNSIDYNNDGFEDLYTSYANHISIFENDANQNFNNEISVYQDNNLIMGAVQIVDVDNQNGLDYVWSGGNNAIAFHMNESLLNIEDLEAPTILLYPNPTNGILNSTHQIDKLRIYNLQGVKLMEAYKTDTIDLSRLPAGFYTLIIEDHEDLAIYKIIKN